MSSDRKLYILCGGKSRRMGSDKALLTIDGEKLIERQIRKANPYFDEIVLLNGENSYQLENRQLYDEFDNAGPLAGLFEALKDGSKHSLNEAAIIPVDLPDISKETLKKLSENTLAESVDAVFLQNGEDLQPLAGIYKTHLRHELVRNLNTKNRMVFGFITNLNYSVIDVVREELLNFNTPSDYSF